MSNFIHFLCQQLINEPFELKYSDTDFVIQTENGHYSELLFDSNCNFDKKTISQLLAIRKQPDTPITSDQNIPFVKLWFMLTHEKYFIDNITLDKYGRIGQENLRIEFNTILQLPIADILKKHFQKKLNTYTKPKLQIYYTCDYDTLNIWDVWGFKNYVRESVSLFFQLKIIHLLHLNRSYFFSRKTTKANGYLNFNMFNFKKGVVNIAFFLADPQNEEFDNKIDYTSPAVLQFLQKIKQNKIQTGLHTNFDTNLDNIQNQQTKYQNLFKKKAHFNRHHYLRFIFPDYLEVLEKAEIQTDFSIYFPESMIFRCGTSSSFIPWNQKTETPFKIKIVPTTLMDATFNNYLNCTLNEAITKSKNKLDLAKKYGDSIVLLWHNCSSYKYSHVKNNYNPQLIIELKRFLDQ